MPVLDIPEKLIVFLLFSAALWWLYNRTHPGAKTHK